jgi:hypothetical protein
MIKDTKDTTEKFRLSSNEKAALRRAAKIARIPVSILIRLCLTSRYHVATDPEVLRTVSAERRR